MTREQMVKRSWKPYETILYQDAGMKFPAKCLLSEIDFDAEILTLTPLNDFYNQTEFKANLQFCQLPKMKAAAVNGKKVIENSDNIVKAKMMGDSDYFELDEDPDEAS